MVSRTKLRREASENYTGHQMDTCHKISTTEYLLYVPRRVQVADFLAVQSAIFRSFQSGRSGEFVQENPRFLAFLRRFRHFLWLN